MFKYREIVVPGNSEQVLRTIRNQIRTKIPFGWVDDREFKIYRTITGGKIYDNHQLFCIKGSVCSIGENTHIKYRIRPMITDIVIFSVLVLIFLVSLFSSHNFSLIIPTIILFILVLTCLNTLWQVTECVKHFETKLRV